MARCLNDTRRTRGLAHVVRAADGAHRQHAEVDYSWRSKQYGSADHSEYGQIASDGLLNVRYGINGDLSHGKRWTATLWSNNVFDKHYVTGGVTVANSLYNCSLNPGLPRTYGATLNVKF
jgi:outer membrane receptor protein involved in Fe transport